MHSIKISGYTILKIIIIIVNIISILSIFLVTPLTGADLFPYMITLITLVGIFIVISTGTLENDFISENFFDICIYLLVILNITMHIIHTII